jgi:hypothetical protein
MWYFYRSTAEFPKDRTAEAGAEKSHTIFKPLELFGVMTWNFHPGEFAASVYLGLGLKTCPEMERIGKR